jgi:hypothetical protein
LAEQVSRKTLYHVTRSNLKYSTHPLLEVDSKLTAGKESNPFFAYYERSVTLPVKTADGTIQVSVMRYLSAVETGEIDPSDLPRIARSIASHYVMLSRELIMEETRKQIAPDAPSRHTCLWMLETEEQARYWQHRLGGASRIAVIRAWGVVHRADASLLLGDSEPLSETYRRARSYWRGEASDNPETEVLFSGRGEVVGLQ